MLALVLWRLRLDEVDLLATSVEPRPAKGERRPVGADLEAKHANIERQRRVHVVHVDRYVMEANWLHGLDYGTPLHEGPKRQAKGTGHCLSSMAVTQIGSSPVFSSVWAGVPSLHSIGGMTEGGWVARVSNTTLPVSSRRMKWLPLRATIRCLARWVCRGVLSPTSMTVSITREMLVFEHDGMVSGVGYRPVQIVLCNPRHGRGC